MTNIFAYFQDYVYVYDGIPSFMTSGSSAGTTLLAAYCGYDYVKPISVEAKSGYLTVYFEGNIEPSKYYSPSKYGVVLPVSFPKLFPHKLSMYQDWTGWFCDFQSLFQLPRCKIDC